MEIETTTEFETLFPSFVLHKHWQMPEGFNERLYQLASEDCEANRVTDPNDPLKVGNAGHYVAHRRHNFLTDVVDPIMPTFVNMVSYSVREFLWHAFHYQHEGDIHMMSDTFWQRRSHGENLGIPTHTHPAHEIICTYYPRVDDDGENDHEFSKGALRFYNPAMRGGRLWPTNEGSMYNGQTYSVRPRAGSMVVFEGHMPHDSTFFEGDERMCIPILCKLDLPNKHQHATISEIMEVQNGI